MSERLQRQWWITAFVLTALVLVMAPFKPLPRVSIVLYDMFSRWDSARMRDDIAVVEIDNASLERLGPWPWPRERQAALVRAIGSGRPKAIALNIVLADRKDAAGDVVMREALRETGVPVFLGIAVEARTGGEVAAASTLLLQPSPMVAGAAAGLGHTSLPVSEDGMVRRTHWELSAGGQPWPNLMVLLADAASPGGPSPTSAAEGSLIPFASRGEVHRLPAWKVLAEPAAAAELEGRRVIVGVTATGIATKFPTPLAPRDGYVSGSEIEAHVLSGLLDGRERREVGMAWLFLCSVLPVWLLLVCVRRAKPGWAALCTPFMVVAVLVTDWLLLTRLGLWVPPGICLFVLLLVHPLWSWRRLAAVMSFMESELDGFRSGRTEPALQSQGDPIMARVDLLSQAIAEARAARRFVEDVVHRLPAPAVVLDRRGGVVFGNEAATRLFARFSIGDLTQADLTALLACFSSDKDEVAAPRMLSAAEAEQQGAPLQLRSRDGASFELRLGALHGPDGTVRAWIFQLTETTQAKAAVRQREEVLQLLTHDIRSPLVSILATLGQAGTMAQSPAGSRIAKYAQRALTLADEFVLLARARSPVYHREPVCMRHLLEEAIEEARPQCETAGVSIGLSGDDEPSLVEGDSSLLLRAIVNLLSNAIKYGANGGVIACRVADVAEADGQRVIVEVRDWGKGMPPEDLLTIFDRFRQGRSAELSKGVGLGLAFVETVMRRHGGTVTCRSEEDAGSSFILSLPVMPAQDASFDNQRPGEGQVEHKGSVHAYH